MKALLVVDMQNVCVGERHTPYFRYDNKKVLDAVNHVIDSNAENIVVYIRNIMKKGIVNKFAPFHAYEGTEEVELVSGLHRVSDFVFDKYAGDAFSNEALERFLQEKNIDEIEVIGVDGGGCVALTALGAVKRGYQVTVNTQAIGTMFHKNKEKCFKRLAERGATFV